MKEKEGKDKRDHLCVTCDRIINAGENFYHITKYGYSPICEECYKKRNKKNDEND